MSTRGAYGFRKEGKDKITYNDFDSYPDGLGEKIISALKNSNIDEITEAFDRILLVNSDDKPTEFQLKELVNTLPNYTFYKDKDWYEVLRPFQGDLSMYLDSPKLSYMIDNGSFIKDSIFCEYAYIFDINTNCLEFYKGFQKTPQMGNRYGVEQEDGYYPCKLVTELKLELIQSQSVETSLSQLNNFEIN